MNKTEVLEQLREMLRRTEDGLRHKYAEAREMMGVDARLAFLVELRATTYTVACGDRDAVLHVLAQQFPQEIERARLAFRAMDDTLLPIVGLWTKDDQPVCGIVSIQRSVLDQGHCERGPNAPCRTSFPRTNVCKGTRAGWPVGLGGLVN